MALFGKPDIKKLEEKKNVKGLIKALEDSDKDVRRQAVAALARKDDQRAVEPMIKALEDSDKDVRWQAVKALAWKDDQRVVGRIIRALEDSDSDVRAAAAKALEGWADKPALLMKGLEDNDSEVRAAAARALGRIGDPLTVVPLHQLLMDTNWHVSKAAAEALDNKGDAGVKVYVDGLALRPPAGLVVGQQDAARVKQIRLSCVEGLARISSQRVVEPLAKALVDSDSDVRAAAAEALDKMGDTAVEPLIKVREVSDSDARAAIDRILKKIEISNDS